MVAMVFGRRFAPLQKRRIRRRLNTPLVVSTSSIIDRFVVIYLRQRSFSHSSLNRPNEEKVLLNHIQNPPSGPIVMVGPEGIGKSILLKKVKYLTSFLAIFAFSHLICCTGAQWA